MKLTSLLGRTPRPAPRRPRQPALRVEALEGRELPNATLVVGGNGHDDDHGHHFATIQAAVNAASPGDTILVKPGTYHEQVTIPAGKDGITLQASGSSKGDHDDQGDNNDQGDNDGHGDNGKTVNIAPPATLTGTQALVWVDGARNVTIDGFTIAGPSSSLNYGIEVDAGGSALITDNHITNIRHAPLDGVQTGVGILIGSGPGETFSGGSAVISGNLIDRYQKGGIVVLDPHSVVAVLDNTIVGSGPTGVISQNGIQVSDGASAVVTGNSVSGNVYTGTDDQGTGILLISPGTVSVVSNRVFNNQVGIEVDGTTGSTLLRNQVTHNTGDGVHVTAGSSGNVIALNDLRGNAGFDAFDDTTGSGTAGTANTWTGNRIGKASPSGLR
jgi:parallel beta-helix repeat protein